LSVMAVSALLEHLNLGLWVGRVLP
jgi:hypothetical protein